MTIKYSNMELSLVLQPSPNAVGNGKFQGGQSVGASALQVFPLADKVDGTPGWRGPRRETQTSALIGVFS